MNDKTTELLKLDDEFNTIVTLGMPSQRANAVLSQKDVLLQSMNDAEKYDYFREKALAISGLSRDAFERQMTDAVGEAPSKKLVHTLEYLDTMTSLSPVGFYAPDME